MPGPAYLVLSGSFSSTSLTSLSAVLGDSETFVTRWMSTYLNISSRNHLMSGSALLGTSIMYQFSPMCRGYPFILETKYITVAMSRDLR